MASILLATFSKALLGDISSRVEIEAAPKAKRTKYSALASQSSVVVTDLWIDSLRYLCSKLQDIATVRDTSIPSELYNHCKTFVELSDGARIQFNSIDNEFPTLISKVSDLRLQYNPGLLTPSQCLILLCLLTRYSSIIIDKSDDVAKSDAVKVMTEMMALILGNRASIGQGGLHSLLQTIGKKLLIFGVDILETIVPKQLGKSIFGEDVMNTITEVKSIGRSILKSYFDQTFQSLDELVIQLDKHSKSSTSKSRDSSMTKWFYFLYEMEFEKSMDESWLLGLYDCHRKELVIIVGQNCLLSLKDSARLHYTIAMLTDYFVYTYKVKVAIYEIEVDLSRIEIVVGILVSLANTIHSNKITLELLFQSGFFRNVKYQTLISVRNFLFYLLGTISYS